MRAVAILAFKVLALLAVLLAVGSGARVLPAMVARFPYDAENGSSILMLMGLLAPIVLPLVLGGLLWFGADKLAGMAVKDADAGPSPSFESLQELAFSCIGTIVLALAIPNVAKVAYYYWQLSIPGGLAVGTDVERRAAIFELCTQIIIGLWLLLGARGFANLMQRIRGR